MYVRPFWKGRAEFAEKSCVKHGEFRRREEEDDFRVRFHQLVMSDESKDMRDLICFRV